MKNEVFAKDKGKVVCRKTHNRDFVLRPVLRHPRLVDGKLLVPKRWIKMKDTPACLVICYEVMGASSYGALNTKVIHVWPPKSVLRRAGWR